MSRDWILREQGSRDWRMLPIAIVMWARVWERTHYSHGGCLMDSAPVRQRLMPELALTSP